MMDIPGEILVRGSPFTLLYSPGKAYLRILETLGVSALNPLQTRLISAIRAGLDVIVAGPPSSGKTTGYLVPVVGYVAEELKRTRVKPETPSPYAIIICASSLSARSVSTDVRQALRLSHRTQPKSILVDNVGDAEVQAKFKEGVDILTTTASTIRELLKNGGELMKTDFKLSFDRLKFVVFEELGMAEAHFSAEIICFLRMLHVISDDNSSHDPPDSLQLVLCGTLWSSCIDNVYYTLYKNKRTAAMILGSAVEALQFSRINWEIHYLPGEEPSKLNCLADICKVMLQEEKTIVVTCSSQQVAKEVHHHLFVTTKALTGELPQQHTTTQLLVVSDQDLDEAKITSDSQQCLILYDHGPLDDGQPFEAKRFACLWPKLQRKGCKRITDIPQVHFLLGGKEENLVALHRFLNTVTTDLPENLEGAVEEKMKMEITKLPLCTLMKCFGFCDRSFLGICFERHEILESDFNSDFPNHGEVEFVVVECINPSLYTARMLKHWVFQEGQRVCVQSYEDELKTRTSQMMTYFSNSSNCRESENITLRELYCLRTLLLDLVEIKKYLRVRVDKFLSHGEVGVSCIDYGITAKVNKFELLEMPDQFKKWAAPCGQVIVSNLLPANGGTEYLSDGLRVATRLAKGKIWQGKILLTLNDSIWINPMVQYVKDPVTGHITKGPNMRCELARGNYAEALPNHFHMQLLLKSIHKIKPDFPEFPHEANNFDGDCQLYNPEDGISWTGLRLSTIEPEEVQLVPIPITIYAWSSPWEIFGAPTQFHDENFPSNVTQLEWDLTQVMDRRTKFQNLSQFKSSFRLQTGSVVAVKCSESQRWRRGMILHNSHEDDDWAKISVFLVDYGITLFDVAPTEIMPIPKVYVSRLEFQVVCLKLGHVFPVETEEGESWDDCVLKLTDILEPSNGISSEGRRNVNVIAMTKIEGSQHPCLYYEAIIFQSQSSDGQELITTDVEDIGVQLANRGSACMTPASAAVLGMVKYAYEDFIGLRSRETEGGGGGGTGSEADFDFDEERDESPCEPNVRQRLRWEHFFKDDSDEERPGPPVKEIERYFNSFLQANIPDVPLTDDTDICGPDVKPEEADDAEITAEIERLLADVKLSETDRDDSSGDWERWDPKEIFYDSLDGLGYSVEDSEPFKPNGFNEPAAQDLVQRFGSALLYKNPIDGHF